MNFFLKLKHWHLFAIIFGLPIVVRIVLIINTLWRKNNQFEINPFLNVLAIVLTLSSTIIFFSWLWSAGIGIQKKIPIHYQPKKLAFFICFWTIFLIILGLLLKFLLAFGLDVFNLRLMSFAILILFVYVMLLLLLIVIPMGYCLLYVAKNLRTLELNRKVHFSDFANEFFLLILFPIGIWFIQPRINKLLENEITQRENHNVGP